MSSEETPVQSRTKGKDHLGVKASIPPCSRGRRLCQQGEELESAVGGAYISTGRTSRRLQAASPSEFGPGLAVGAHLSPCCVKGSLDLQRKA